MARIFIIASVWTAVCLALMVAAYDPVEAAEDHGEELAQFAVIVVVGVLWLIGVGMIVLIGRRPRPN